MKLTQEQKRVKLAEACGWKRTPKDNVGAAARLFYGDVWWRDAENNTIASADQLPDYFNDLNACHEAEKVLTLEQSTQYVNVLWPQGYAPFQAVHAAAPQRAIAFLLTLQHHKTP